MRTSSSAVKNRVWNLRIVSVVPPRLHGGHDGRHARAVRQPRVEDRLLFGHVVAQGPGDVLDGDLQIALVDPDAGDLLQQPVPLDEHPPRRR